MDTIKIIIDVYITAWLSFNVMAVLVLALTAKKYERN